MTAEEFVECYKGCRIQLKYHKWVPELEGHKGTINGICPWNDSLICVQLDDKSFCSYGKPEDFELIIPKDNKPLPLPG